MAGYDGLRRTGPSRRGATSGSTPATPGRWTRAAASSFRDRIKDCIRRRGENISSFEVEAAIGKLPGVAEVAAFAVPAGGGEGTEDEVMLAVIAQPGVTLDPAEIATRADAVLPAFASPRFVEIVDRLPKTPTERVQKNKLRERGVTPGHLGPKNHRLTARRETL